MERFEEPEELAAVSPISVADESAPESATEVSLEHRTEFVALAGLAAVECVILFLLAFTDGWSAAVMMVGPLLLTALIAVPIFVATRGLRLRMAAERLEVWRSGRHLRSIPRDQVRTVRMRKRWVTVLELRDEREALGWIPVPGDPAPFSLLPFLSHYLGPRVRFEREVRGTSGSRAVYLGAGAVSLTVGIASFVVAFQHLQWELSAPRQNSLWTCAGSLGVAGIGLFLLFRALNHVPGGVRYEPIEAAQTRTLLPLIEAIDAGSPLAGRRAFAYPERVRQSRQATPRSRDHLGVLPLAVAAAFMGVFLLFIMVPPGREVVWLWLLLMALVLGPLGIVLFRSVRTVRQTQDLEAGVFDSVLVDGDRISVLRGSRCVPARTAAFVRNNVRYQAPDGWNASRVLLDFGEERVWYDPAAMIEVDVLGEALPDARPGIGETD